MTGETWQLDPTQSIVRLRARVLGIPTNCKVDVRRATAQLSADRRSGQLLAEIDLTTFRSGNDRRDEHVKSADFLDVAQHPLATFTATWADLEWPPSTVTGDLQVHGVTVPVTVAVTGDVSDDTVTFHGATVLSRRAFGVDHTRYLLADRVEVTVEGVATQHPTLATPYGEDQSSSATKSALYGAFPADNVTLDEVERGR